MDNWTHGQLDTWTIGHTFFLLVRIFWPGSEGDDSGDKFVRRLGVHEAKSQVPTTSSESLRPLF